MRKIKFIKNQCNTCHSCEIACALKHSPSENIDEVANIIPRPVPRIHIIFKKDKLHMEKCVFCKNPKCVEACEYDAIKKHDDGYVEFFSDKCTACWECIEACPFDAIQKSLDENIVVKCDLCRDREVPSCVGSCHTEALVVVEGEVE